MKRKEKIVLIACAIVEWFDFILFVFLSSPISNYFLPSYIPKTEKYIIMLLILISPYLMRPIGGILLGYLADKINRRKVFVYTAILMLISSISIIFIPSYSTLGFVSIFLLLVCRFIQSFSIGGEYVISTVLLFENSATKYRYFTTSFINFGTVLGSLLAQGVFVLLYVIWTRNQIIDFYWKIPFCITSFLFIGVFYIRKTNSTYINFKNNFLSNQHTVKLEDIKYKIFFTFLYLAFGGVGYYFFVVMGKHIMISGGISNYESTIITVIGLISLLCMIPVSGYLADKINPIKVQIIGVIFIIFFSILYKYLILQNIFLISILTEVIFACGLSMYLGVMPAFISSIFNAKYRCTLLGLSYNVALAIFGAATPVIISILITKYNYGDVLYLIIAGLLTLTSFIYFRNKHVNTR